MTEPQAEPIRDYATLSVQGVEYKLALDFNALADMEDVGSVNGLELISMAGPPFKASRLMLFFALRKYHTGQFPTLESVGILLQKYLRDRENNLTTLTKVIHAALAASGFAAFEEATGKNAAPPEGDSPSGGG